MTVPATLRLVERLADGVARNWPFSFLVYDATHLRVSVRKANGDVIRIDPANYTVALGAGNALDGFAGGTITYPIAPAPVLTSGSVIIELVPPLTQTGIDLENTSGFNPKAAERQFDLLTQGLQWVDQRPQIYLDPADGALTLPRRVPGRFIVATPAGIDWYPPNVTFDASGVTFESVTVAQTLNISAPAIYCLGYSSPGDGGAAVWRAVESEPSHGGKFQSTDEQWWELAADPVTPEMFGAVGDGVADDGAALAAFWAYLVAKRVEGHLPGTYGVTAPWVCTGALGVTVRGPHGRTEAGKGAPISTQDTIVKLSGFAGDAALIIGENNDGGVGTTNAIRGCAFEGIRVNGAGHAGAGIIVRKASACSFNHLDSENNAGDGIVFDGLWECEIQSPKARGNGAGMRFTNTERKNTNVYIWALHCSNNDARQLHIECHPTNSLLRPEQLDFVSGIIELPAIGGDLTAQPYPLCEIEACRVVKFFGTHFMQRGSGSTPTLAPCVVLGRSGHTLTPTTVIFENPRFQHSWAAAADNPAAVKFANDVDYVAISDPDTGSVESASKLIDGANLTSGTVVLRGAVYRQMIRNNAAGLISIQSATLEASQSAEGGANLHVVAPQNTQLILGRKNGSGGFVNGLLLGGGASLLRAEFQGMDPRLTPRSAPVGDVIDGYLFASNGTGSAPFDVPGLFARVSGSWVNLGGGGWDGNLGDIDVTGANEGDVLTIVSGVPDWSAPSGAGLGDVSGPASATANAIALFDGTSGKTLKDSTYTITAAGAALLDDANAAAQRATLGLVIGTDVAPMSAFTASTPGLAPASGGGTTNYLRADGTWAAPSGGGTVTSVAISGSNGIQVNSGSPITSAGTIALGIDAAALRSHINVADGATANTGTVTSVAVSGSGGITVTSGSPVTTSGTIALNIANGALTLAKLADQSQATLVGRAAAAGTGAPSALTATQVRTLLNVADGAQANVYASAAEARTGTESAKAIAPDVAYSAMAPVTLTDGATITPDMQAGRVFTVTLGGNRTLANPSNQVAGQSGLIIVSQDATGNRTLSYGTAWKFPGGAPALSTAANAKDVISYYVQASGTILCNLTKAYS